MVELLAVIAIIALLAALVFPSLREAREAGRRALCLSNIRQTLIGHVTYSADFDISIDQSSRF